ncbi:hypothetical protein [Acinetobacter courvalinii]|uniref:hypothetical protein n=1 Tax=Acinetobacter courvalinii TaxID=280147 RepID=UPI0002D0D4A7|nr:hypothetical protein [Acinetobacter courvalinii]ENX05694.1 hypothetical protein F898_02638 [Acinetobacter courvalinii]
MSHWSGMKVQPIQRKTIYTNHLGSVVALANTTGASTATYTYGPYGEPNTTAGNMRFRYTGQQLLAT